MGKIHHLPAVLFFVIASCRAGGTWGEAAIPAAFAKVPASPFSHPCSKTKQLHCFGYPFLIETGFYVQISSFSIFFY